MTSLPLLSQVTLYCQLILQDRLSRFSLWLALGTHHINPHHVSLVETSCLKHASRLLKIVLGNHLKTSNSLFSVSVHRSSSLDWKKDWNRTEPNCKRPDHWLQLHKFWKFFGCQLQGLSKIRKPKQKNQSRQVSTGLSSHHALDLTHAHFSLIYPSLVSLWIIKHSQELVEIWPKTFLYTTQMYVPSVFTISQPNLNEIAWNFDQSTGN